MPLKSPLTFINLIQRCVNLYSKLPDLVLKLNKTYYEEDLTAGLSLLIAMASLAQQKEGKVTYERNTQMSININNGAEPIQHIRKDKFELNFANNQMVWQQLPEDIQEEPVSNGGMVFRTVGGGGDDIVFIDFEKSRKVEGREFGDKNLSLQIVFVAITGGYLKKRKPSLATSAAKQRQSVLPNAPP